MARRAKKKSSRRRPGKLLLARTNGMRLVNQVAFVVLVATGCVAVAVMSVPQVRQLGRLKGELGDAEARERETLERRDQKERELAALRSDPSYLELIARDRLDLYRSGEKIFRFNRK